MAEISPKLYVFYIWWPHFLYSIRMHACMHTCTRTYAKARVQYFVVVFTYMPERKKKKTE